MGSRTLFHNGHIITLDPKTPRAEALAVLGGRVLHAGGADECRAALGPGHEAEDLRGAWVIPGLADSHIHFTWYARGLREVDVEPTASAEEAAELVRERVAGAAPGEWVLGSGWNFNRWHDRRPPERAQLDRVAPDNPVALRSKDRHSLWVNSRALELAGITAQTPDPPGGKIVRGPGGEPSGWLLEDARDPVWEAQGRAPQSSLKDLLKEAFPSALALGITTIHDFDGREAIEAYTELRADDELPIRVLKSVPLDSLDWALAEGLRSGQGDEWLRIGSLKIFTDGALGSHSALMLDAYSGEPGNTGVEVTPPDELQELVLRAARGGLSCALHAIGDRANRNALDAFERARREGVGAGLRHRIEHVQHLHPDDLPRLRELDIIASMQPLHATSDMETADALLGDRPLLSYAWRTLQTSGVRLAFGSDCPVEPLDPWLGFHAAVTRQRDGLPPGGWQPHERLSPEEALRAFTEGAAWCSVEERLKGHLARGMFADFVLLGADPLEGPPDKIAETRPLATYVDGREAYRA
jgi:predicted amidohydrolase YtcJ